VVYQNSAEASSSRPIAEKGGRRKEREAAFLTGRGGAGFKNTSTFADTRGPRRRGLVSTRRGRQQVNQKKNKNKKSCWISRCNRRDFLSILAFFN
jgi:hypothetical protein